jgi:CubicO group peptidase (beta-lactamase class C family)
MNDAIDPTTLDDLSHCPSAVVAVVTPMQSFVRGYGRAHDGEVTPPDGDTIFQIGSVTKVFTGLGIAELVVNGLMQVTDSVSGSLPAEVVPSTSWPDPTLRDLVTHYAGFRIMPTNVAPEHPLSPAEGYSRADLREYLESWTPLEPRAYRYSNTGIGILGLVLEEHVGTASFDAAIRATVLSDLGMNDTYGETAAIPDSARVRMADGHFAQGAQWTPGVFASMGALAGAGEMASTGNDMLRFLEVMSGKQSTSLDAAIELATTPIAPAVNGFEIGYAITIERGLGMDRFMKAGNTPSFGAFIVFRRSRPTGVAVLSSCGDDFPVHELAMSIFDAVLPIAELE